MDGEISAWIAKGVISCVIVSLGFAVRGLFSRLREAEARIVAIEKTPPPCDAAGREAKAELQDFKLCVAEHYVRRDDYITTQSRIMGLQEAHGIALARLEERIGTLIGAMKQ